jgi:hypothetical protein
LHPYSLFYALTMRWMIPGVLLLVLGAEAVFGSFLLSLGMRRRWSPVARIRRVMFVLSRRPRSL